ncbi:MAG: hypothetical protein JSS72_01360 [Armatimonadetes bacterium]|nr:hypothetical protein [Armatimonadota bacterium]
MSLIAVAILLTGAMGTEPTYQDRRSQIICHGALIRYDEPPSMLVSVTSAGKRIDMGMQKDMAFQMQGGTGWKYDGASLSFYSGSKLKGRVKVPRISAPRQIYKHGLEIDPLLRQWAFSNSPARSLLAPGLIAKWGGKKTINGVRCEAVILKSKALRVTVWVRTTDALFARTVAENLDAKGHVVNRSDRSYRYKQVGKTISKSRFR